MTLIDRISSSVGDVIYRVAPMDINLMLIQYFTRLWFDTMNGKNLWAPWRLQYLESLEDDILAERASLSVAGPSKNIKATQQSGGCFLTDYWQSPDEDATNLVVFRNAHGLILLNRYPYSNGHLLIALGEPRPTLLDYEPKQRASLWELVERASGWMDQAINPQGKNIGINEGQAAGAGVPQHLHVHIVPRWSGDTNFMTTVGAIRVIPSSLEAMYARYCAVVRA